LRWIRFEILAKVGGQHIGAEIRGSVPEEEEMSGHRSGGKGMGVSLGGGDNDWDAILGLLERAGQQRDHGLQRRCRGVLLGDEVVPDLPALADVTLGLEKDVEQHRLERHTLVEETGGQSIEGARVTGEGRSCDRQLNF
jgi:hypothetical protein